MTTSQISDTLMDILFCLGEQSDPQACRLCHPWLYAGREKGSFKYTNRENESSKYWLSVLNELKNRGVKDILILCSDGLTGIKEAISAAFPKTEQQRCIAHMVRNTLKYVSDKDRKAFSTDLKTIYHAANEEKALEALEKVTEKWTPKYPNSMKQKWTPKYPNSMKRWHDNWDVLREALPGSRTPHSSCPVHAGAVLLLQT